MEISCFSCKIRPSIVSLGDISMNQSINAKFLDNPGKIEAARSLSKLFRVACIKKEDIQENFELYKFRTRRYYPGLEEPALLTLSFLANLLRDQSGRDGMKEKGEMDIGN